MICPTCHGIGEVLIGRTDDGSLRIAVRLRDATMMIPCPDCGGSGFAHCCEGDSACNDPENEKGATPC